MSASGDSTKLLLSRKAAKHKIKYFQNGSIVASHEARLFSVSGNNGDNNDATTATMMMFLENNRHENMLVQPTASAKTL